MFNRIPADMPVGIPCWDSILVEDLWVIVMQPDNVFTEWQDRQPIGSIFQSRDSLHLHWWYWLKMRYKVSDAIWIYHFKNFNENCCIGWLIQCIVSKQWPLNIQKSLDTSFCNFIVVCKNIQAPNAVLMWLLNCSFIRTSAMQNSTHFDLFSSEDRYIFCERRRSVYNLTPPVHRTKDDTASSTGC